MANEQRCTETVSIEIKVEENSSKNTSPRHGNTSISKEDEEIESAKAEMDEVKEENERLKKILNKIENDYRSLQMQFMDVLQRDPPPKSAHVPEFKEFEQPQTSLCLGKSPFQSRIISENKNRPCEDPKSKAGDGLTLGLDLIGPSETGQPEMETANSSCKTRELGGARPPRIETKEPSETSTAKRARVSIRSRCETPTMHDGCQWRKYGQKTAKGNPCPRAYYRCTISPTCPVRKQVQRCSDDMSILITTYEGTHNHPLPVAATAMASTTSAAASMLLSRSSTSQELASSSAPATANINGLNFTIFDNSSTRPFNFPHASSLAPPTITLDLTSNPIRPPVPWGGISHLNYTPSVQYNKTVDFAKQANVSTGGLNQQVLTDTIAKVLASAPSFQQALASAITNMDRTGSGNFTNSWRASTAHGSIGNGDRVQELGFASIKSSPQMGRVPCFTSCLSNSLQSTSPAMQPASSSAAGGGFALFKSLLPSAPLKGSSSMAPNVEGSSNS